MPHRLTPFTTKIQWITFAGMPMLIYRACKQTKVVSQTRYVQVAVCEKLSHDLDIPLEDLLARLPDPRGPARALLYRRDGPGIGPANTVEEVGGAK